MKIIKLKKVYIEITNICNLSCSFCVKSKREPRFMSVSEFETALINIKPLANSIYMHVLGEPLLHKDIGKMLDICEKHNISASITTNASLIDEAKHNLIGKKMLRQINYSLHSISDNGKDYNDILSSINNFIKETENIYHCLRSWNAEIDSDETITHGNGVKIEDNVFVQNDYPFTWGSVENEDIVFEGKCLALRHNCGILANGTVVPCCLDSNGDIALGNIFDDKLINILNTKRAKAMYNGFSQNIPVEKLCRTCGFLKRLNEKRNYSKNK